MQNATQNQESPQDAPQPVYMENGKPLEVMRFNADGTTERTPIDPVHIEDLVNLKAQEMVGEIKISQAKRRFQELKRPDAAPSIERHEILGKEWFTRKANFEGINRMMMLTPRDKKGRLIMGAEGVLNSLMAAMLFVCVVSGQTDETPFFEEWEEAYEFATDSDEAIVETCSALFSAILKQSPSIWPEGKEQLEEAERELAEDVPLVFTPSPSTAQADGSTATTSTNLQVVLPEPFAVTGAESVHIE